MNMHDYALNELRKIEKQILNDNRKLDALRLVIKEFATEKHPSTARLNTIITECLNRHEGKATFQQIIECVEDHHIMMPRNKLSVLLTNHKGIKFDKEEKYWRILPVDKE